jgi:KDO2-lipid IV(A) lauroyltransferase
MYYVVYGLLYLVSLLPFRVLYLFSDLGYFIIYRLLGYRKSVVMSNLAIAFPAKPPKERKKIASEFYRNFVDTFIETIKLLSMSDREFDRRCTGDFDLLNRIAAKGSSIQMMGGHQFNWEFVNLVCGRHLELPFIGVVANVENKILNRIYFKFRARYGTILIPNSSFQRQMIELMRKQYSICLLADQNTYPLKAFWLNFFGRPVPFIIGPHKTAVKNKPVLVYYDFRKLKRGHYTLKVSEVLENTGSFTAKELALKYRDHLEQVISSEPTNYLWSHRRWKYPYSEVYREQWIDVRAPGEFQ